MSKINSRIVIAATAIPFLVLTSCQSVEKKEPEKKENRFAFLEKGKKDAKKIENYESASVERIQPKDAERPVVEASTLEKFGLKAPEKTAVADLAKASPKFYEDFIALNGDEELEVSLVFNSAPLLDVLSAFGDLLGFNFVADSDLKGVVTLNLNSKMTRRELWNTFDRMVYLAGAAVKVEDSLLRVMALNKFAMQPDNRSGKGSKTEIYYRQLINATSTEVSRQLRGFIGNGAIIAGDAEINDAVADIKGDVAGAQKDKIDIIFGVADHEFAAGAYATVSGAFEQRNCTFRQGTLVGYRQLQISAEIIHKYL